MTTTEAEAAACAAWAILSAAIRAHEKTTQDPEAAVTDAVVNKARNNYLAAAHRYSILLNA